MDKKRGETFLHEKLTSLDEPLAAETSAKIVELESIIPSQVVVDEGHCEVLNRLALQEDGRAQNILIRYILTVTICRRILPGNFPGQGGIKCGNRGTGFLDSEGSHR